LRPSFDCNALNTVGSVSASRVPSREYVNKKSYFAVSPIQEVLAAVDGTKPIRERRERPLIPNPQPPTPNPAASAASRPYPAGHIPL
jgi:hypothetical protein